MDDNARDVVQRLKLPFAANRIGKCGSFSAISSGRMVSVCSARAYSRYANTYTSLPNLLNFSAEPVDGALIPGAGRGGLPKMRQNHNVLLSKSILSV